MRPERNAPWWRIVAFRLFAVAAGLVAGTALMEGVARYAFPDDMAQLRLPGYRFEPSDVPGIPFLLRPNAEGWTNNLGLRNPRDVALEKAPETFRVLIVGDSVTSLRTDGVPPEPLYPTVLADLLAQRLQTPIEVLNLSSPGLATDQELALIRARGLRLHPDLIVIAYAANDSIHTDIESAANVAPSWFLPVRLLRLWRYQRERKSADEWYRPDTDVLQHLDHTFGELAALAAEQPVVLVALPLRNADRAQQIHLEPVAELCRRHHLRCLDIFPRMQPYLSSLQPGATTDLLHYDSAGHRALAEALADPLAQIIGETEPSPRR